MLLHVQSQLEAPRAVVTAVGEMDMSTADLVRVEVLQAFTSGCIDVTIDLSEVTFIDSVSLGVLVGCHKTLRASGGSLRIVTGKTVRRMLAISGLDQVFTVAESWAAEEQVA